MIRRAVAWDIDGTLVDSEPRHHRALLAASLRWGADFSDLPDQAFRGVHMGDVWDVLRHRLPGDLGMAEWLAAINACYAADRGAMAPMPGAVRTMRALADRGVAQICVSNSSRPVVDANLAALGIGDCIIGSVSLDDVGAGKPDPTPYREACRRLALSPQQVVAVEDSTTGARSARAAGLFVVGYCPDGGGMADVDLATGDLRDILTLVMAGE